MLYNTRYFLLMLFLSLFSLQSSGQFRLPFGDISMEDLSNKTYKADPGADAIVISETGIAVLAYQRGFYLAFEKDIKIRIVNSNGFGYADIEIPYFEDDYMVSYRGSTFNLRNGEKIETKIPKKSFIIEKTSPTRNTLKFNFPDVHEGSVIEYSYKIYLRNAALIRLIPWEFQHEIPVLKSSFTVAYPDAFVYKSLILGSAKDIQTRNARDEVSFFGQGTTESIFTWSATNVPAFRPEPFILNNNEHLTKLSFELASVEFPNISYNDLSPTYERLNDRLFDMEDFGIPLNTNFRALVTGVTSTSDDELTKLKKIHRYISTKIFWDGNKDFTASADLRSVLRKGKGNSADINMILITMLRSAGINADPVILSTRSNGSLKEFSAILQQFNYLVAGVTAGGKFYLVDATDPLRPFDQLPFDCLNNKGRLIHRTDSRFVDLKNNEKYSDYFTLELKFDNNGNLYGDFKYTASGYSALDIRNQIRLESEEGYTDSYRSRFPDMEMKEIKISGLEDNGADVIVSTRIRLNKSPVITDNSIVIKPFLSFSDKKNPFYSDKRQFPIDLGCPRLETYSLKLLIPDGYSVVEKPSDISFTLGNEDGNYEFSCKTEGNEIKILSKTNVRNTYFQSSEYNSVRSFYQKILQNKAELIILKKNPFNK